MNMAARYQGVNLQPLPPAGEAVVLHENKYLFNNKRAS